MSANARPVTTNVVRNAAQRTPAQNKALADARLLRTLYQVHWISAAVSLILLLLFAMTGVVLNHSSVFKTEPVVVKQEAQLPTALLPVLTNATAEVKAAASMKAGGSPNRSATARGEANRDQGPELPLPAQVDAWLTQQFSMNTSRAEARVQADTVRVTKRTPGHQTVVAIDLTNGLVKHEATDRGWLAYLTDLHKAKSAGDAWRWFVDFFAFGVLVFAITGLWILQRHAPRRRAVWPTVALGAVLPIAVILLFVR